MRGSMAGDGELKRLGRYVLLRTSGAGGMGRIDLALRARAGGAPRLCVLKRVHAELRSREQDARFRREANIALQLSHLVTRTPRAPLLVLLTALFLCFSLSTIQPLQRRQNRRVRFWKDFKKERSIDRCSPVTQTRISVRRP